MGDSRSLTVLDVKVEIQDAVTEMPVTPKNTILEAEFEDECLFVPETSAGNVLTEIETIPISLSVEKNASITTAKVPSKKKGSAGRRKSLQFTEKNGPPSNQKKKKSNYLFGRVASSLLCSACARSYTGKCAWHDKPQQVGNCDRKGSEVSVMGRLKCKLCFRQFLHIRNLNAHVKGVHRMQHKCENCPVKFLLASNLAKHVSLVHSEIRRFKCDKCSFHFVDEESFTEHKKRCSAEPEVAGGSGSQTLSTPNNEAPNGHAAQGSEVPLKDEPNTDSPQTKANGRKYVGLYKCGECSRSFRWKSGLVKHADSHKGVKFTCTYCGRIYTRQDKLATHQKECSMKKVKKPSQDDALPLPLQSTSNSSKGSAILGKGVNGATTCSLCHMKCASSISLRNHMRFFHKSTSGPSPGSSIFSSNGEMNQNLDLQRSRSSSSFECHICHEKFQQSERLRNHLPVAHGGGGERVKVKCEATQEVKHENACDSE